MVINALTLFDYGAGELLPVPMAAADVRDVGHTRAFRDVRRG